VTYYSKSFYTATFTYKFKYTGDTVYFAYAQPYTYSELRDDLASIEADTERNCFVTTKTLCQTLGGINCEYLTITSKSKAEGVPKLDKRPGIIITSRVHPGETVGSHMMRGVLEFLTNPTNEEARLLRENYVFKIIPMLNPDGVVNGNYRCSLAGCDLNRRWKTPSKMLHPTIYYTKKLVK
jgi:murein tripeptide amidase MpaA